MRLIEWLWSIATGSMPDTTGNPQGSTRPCLSHSSPANASSPLLLRFWMLASFFRRLLTSSFRVCRWLFIRPPEIRKNEKKC